MRFIFSFFLILGLFSNITHAKKFNSCSEKWNHKLRLKYRLAITGYSFFTIVPLFGTIGGPIGIGIESIFYRRKLKAINLLNSANNLYLNKNTKYMIDETDLNRVKKFYNKYIIKNKLVEIKFSQVVEILSKYNNIAYKINKCNRFYRVYIADNNGPLLERSYDSSPYKISHSIFDNGKIRPEILEDIKEFEERGLQIIDERKKDLDEWQELFMPIT